MSRDDRIAELERRVKVLTDALQACERYALRLNRRDRQLLTDHENATAIVRVARAALRDTEEPPHD